MKKNLLILSFLLVLSVTGFSQTFFVEKTDDGFEQPIIDKLLELEKKVTIKEGNSDYTIKCLISKSGMGRAKGSIIIFDSKTGDLIKKSKQVNGQTSIFSGYANPRMITMKKIANKHLENLLKNLEK